jgi:hypothetical protein
VTDPDILAHMTREQLAIAVVDRDAELARQAEAAGEIFDALAVNARHIVLLVGEIERMQGRTPWGSANEKRSAVRETKKIEARALHAAGWTIPQIMAKLGRSRRSVESYLRD